MPDPNGGIFAKIIVVAAVSWEWIKKVFTGGKK